MHEQKNLIQRLITFFKKETVLSLAGLLAIISAFVVPPSAAYLDYIDFRVLALLFCLMLVVAGLQSIGLFQYLGSALLSKMKNTRQLTFLLVALCFFTAMFITNDVALITFVPFAVMILSMSGRKEQLIPIVVLQTIAANLGSMLTPIGNPQNLYLYSKFEIPMGTFLLDMLPLTLASAVLLVVSIFLQKSHPVTAPAASSTEKPNGKKLAAYLVLFVVCLACVVRLLSWPIMLGILIVTGLLLDRKLFAKVDYFLLLTFVCFFLFIGNMQNIPAIANFLQSFIQSRELPLSALFSQCISNVPAAILLSGFTTSAKPLLFGVNIGGLGTLIASLASVISYRLYGNSDGAKKGAYMKTFTIYNVIYLVILYAVAWILLR